MSIAHHEGGPLGFGGGAAGPSDVENLGRAGGHDPGDVAVAHDAFERGLGEVPDVRGFGASVGQEIVGGDPFEVGDDRDVGPDVVTGGRVTGLEVPLADVDPSVVTPLRQTPGVVGDAIAFHLGVERGEDDLTRFGIVGPVTHHEPVDRLRDVEPAPLVQAFVVPGTIITVERVGDVLHHLPQVLRCHVLGGFDECRFDIPERVHPFRRACLRHHEYMRPGHVTAARTRPRVPAACRACAASSKC